ncbi:MAG: hypothetical protein ACK4N5_19050 [Myxococcales bacterium]
MLTLVCALLAAIAASAEAAPPPAEPPAAEQRPASAPEASPAQPDTSAAEQVPAGAPAAAAAPPVEKTLEERATILELDEVRLSLPTEEDAEAWAAPGLRIALAYRFSLVRGTGPAWSGNEHGFVLRPQVRIDERWALGASFQYGFGDGIQWAASFEPTFYPTRQLGLTVGLGYAGLYVFRGPQFITPQPSEVASRTITDDRVLSYCEGSGLASLARAEYLFVAGPHFATGPFAQANMQWTACETDLAFGNDPETGRPIVGTQWWRQQGASFGWWFSWR